MFITLFPAKMAVQKLEILAEALTLLAWKDGK
jgi:hypothetical protein